MTVRMWAIIVATLSLTPSAMADPAPFRDKTITYIVATTPGGGYDTYGRLIARYLQNHLPGSRVLVKNVPGAGNIIGANAIYAARPDGLTIGMFNTGLIYDQLIHRQGVMFDLTKFGWLGKAANDTRGLLIATNSPYRTIDDLLNARTPIKFAASGVGAASYNDTRILADALHLKVQIVNGFTGNEGEMSMLRGEVAAQVGTVDSLKEFVANGHGFWALALSGDARELPGIPRMVDYVKDESGRKLLALLQALSELGRLTAGPPGIPANLLASERAAMTEVMHDPAFLSDAKRLGLPIDYLPGEAVEARMKAAMNQPRETMEALQKAAGGGG